MSKAIQKNYSCKLQRQKGNGARKKAACALLLNRATSATEPPTLSASLRRGASLSFRRPAGVSIFCRILSFQHRKAVFRIGAVLLPRLQNRRRKIRTVNRVWKTLRLQAKARSFAVHSAGFTHALRKKITAVKLHARAIGINLHTNSRMRAVRLRRKPLFF